MKKVYGVGINDSLYTVHPTVDGKRVVCPFYSAWKSMLKRCYSAKFQCKYPTYKGCTVCDEWLVFSAFKKWMEKQDWKSKDLDKDILIRNNKIYSSQTCVFVDQKVNKLLNGRALLRGVHPQGVSFDKRRGKYQSRISINGKVKSIGYFLLESEAFEAYKKEKYKQISAIAEGLSGRVKSALLNYKIT